MKKIVQYILLLLFLVFSSATIAGVLTDNWVPTAGTANGWRYISDAFESFYQFEIQGYAIPTGSANYIKIDVDGIYNADGLNGTVTYTSGDSITTYNIDWLYTDGAISESETGTFGTPIVDLKSQRALITVYNPSSDAKTTVSLNIRINES